MGAFITGCILFGCESGSSKPSDGLNDSDSIAILEDSVIEDVDSVLAIDSIESNFCVE